MEISVRNATQSEIGAIVAELKATGRQIMNLEKTPGSEVLVMEQAGARLAFCGYNWRAHAAFPEIFSQTVAPEQRGSHLGSVLVYLIIHELQRLGHPYVYCRMGAQENAEHSLLDRRMQYGFCTAVAAEELPAHWVGLCRDCNLFGGSCEKQVYLRLDTEKFLAITGRLFDLRHNGRQFTFAMKSGAIQVSNPFSSYSPQNSRFLFGGTAHV